MSHERGVVEQSASGRIVSTVPGRRQPAPAWQVREAAPGECGVFAARDLRAGEDLGRFEGAETSARTKWSLQFGPERHIDPGENRPLRFLNHTCFPDAFFGGEDGTTLFAGADIPAGTEITIDYNRHEEELAFPFICRCGAANCVGTVRGWRHPQPS